MKIAGETSWIEDQISFIFYHLHLQLVLIYINKNLNFILFYLFFVTS